MENLLPELKATDNKQTDITQSESLSTSDKTSQIKETSAVQVNNQHTQSIELPTDTIRKIFEQFDSEWVAMTAFGSTWKRLQVDIDPRTYGCKKFTDLVKKHPDIFEYEMRSNEEATQEQMYVKLKI